MTVSIPIEITNITPEQRKALDGVTVALNEFLVAPNDIATEKNNALQKACGQARKAIMEDKISKPVKEKK